MQPPTTTQVVNTIAHLRRWVQTRSDNPIPRATATDSSPEPTWQGARILVCDAPLPRPAEGTDPWNRYERHIHVCTPHASSLAELLNRIRNGLGGLIHAENKYLFYGALAQTALEYQERHPQGDGERSLLLAILEEALELAMGWSLPESTR